MPRTVHCVKLKREAPGLAYAPYPGALGERIWREISQEAWAAWMAIQTRIVNENRLNLADARARRYLSEQMQQFLFEDQDVEAHGYVPPEV